MWSPCSIWQQICKRQGNYNENICYCLHPNLLMSKWQYNVSWPFDEDLMIWRMSHQVKSTQSHLCNLLKVWYSVTVVSNLSSIWQELTIQPSQQDTSGCMASIFRQTCWKLERWMMLVCSPWQRGLWDWCQTQLLPPDVYCIMYRFEYGNPVKLGTSSLSPEHI